MPKDTRQIHLDPMEWRDATKGAAKPKAEKPKAKTKPKAKKR